MGTFGPVNTHTFHTLKVSQCHFHHISNDVFCLMAYVMEMTVKTRRLYCGRIVGRGENDTTSKGTVKTDIDFHTPNI